MTIFMTTVKFVYPLAPIIIFREYIIIILILPKKIYGASGNFIICPKIVIGAWWGEGWRSH